MILWVLLNLFQPVPTQWQEFWLTAPECMKAMAHKPHPDDWACMPVEVNK